MMKPEGVRITNHTELRREIMRLNQRRAEQEEVLRQNFKEIYFSLHPVEILRNAVGKIKGSPETQNGVAAGVAKAGLGLGASFLLNKLLKNKGGFLASLLVEKASNLIANKSSGPVMAGVAKLVAFFTKRSRTQNA